MKQSLLFVYQPEQVPFIEAQLRESDDLAVVALDYGVELELKKHGIPFISLATVAVSPDGDRTLVERTRALALQWYTAPETAFFEHDGIKLGEQHEVTILYYLQALVYWVAMLEQVLETRPDATRLCVFANTVYVSSTADPTATFRERVVEDVVGLLGARRNLAVEVVATPVVQRTRRSDILGVAPSLGVVRALSVVWNTLVSLQKPRPIVLFATDPWYRLEPFMSGMRDVELVMSRRAEMHAMVPGAAWRTRARFNHKADFVDVKMRTLARSRARAIAMQWDTLGEAPLISKDFTYKHISLWPVMREVLGSIVKEHTEDAIATIENTKRLFTHYGVNCVLLFAPNKGYDNLVARVAERANIPSIELQHALSTVEPTLVHSRLNSRYIAAYGRFTRTVYESWGIAPWRIVECGSPRFDTYRASIPTGITAVLRKKLSLDETRVNVMAMVPHVSFCFGYGNFTGYEVQQILKDYAGVQEHEPRFRFVLRPRPSFFRKDFYTRKNALDIFKGEVRMAQEENLRVLISACDFVIAGNSTIVLEALLLRKPVLLYITKKLDRDFQIFENAGAIFVARTQEELKEKGILLKDLQIRAALVEKADTFLNQNFTQLLDGKSGERLSALIRQVTAKSNSSTMSA